MRPLVAVAPTTTTTTTAKASTVKAAAAATGGVSGGGSKSQDRPHLPLPLEHHRHRHPEEEQQQRRIWPHSTTTAAADAKKSSEDGDDSDDDARPRPLPRPLRPAAPTVKQLPVPSESKAAKTTAMPDADGNAPPPPRPPRPPTQEKPRAPVDEENEDKSPPMPPRPPQPQPPPVQNGTQSVVNTAAIPPRPPRKPQEQVAQIAKPEALIPPRPQRLPTEKSPEEVRPLEALPPRPPRKPLEDFSPRKPVEDVPPRPSQQQEKESPPIVIPPRPSRQPNPPEEPIPPRPSLPSRPPASLLSESKSPPRPSVKQQPAGGNGGDISSHPSMLAIENATHPSTDFKHSDYTSADEFAVAPAPQSATRDIPSLARYLGSKFADDDLAVRYRVIFRWIAENIAYDVSYRQRSPEQALRDRMAVCSGYSGLFQSLCDELGLHCESISGGCIGGSTMAGDGFVEMSSHAWNCVIIDGEPRFIDCTWGAGSVCSGVFTRKFESHYFLTPPKKFIFSHLPKDPTNQHLHPHLSIQEWLRLPRLSPPFFNNGVSLASITGERGGGIDPNIMDLSCLRVGIGEQITITLTARNIHRPVHASAILHTNVSRAPIPKGSDVVWLDGADQRGSVVKSGRIATDASLIHAVQDDGGLWFLTLRFRCYEPGDAYLELMLAPEMTLPPARRADNSGHMHLAAAFRVDVVDDGHHVPEDPADRRLPKTYSHNLQLIEPTRGVLRVGETYEFIAAGDEPAVVISPSLNVTRMRPLTGEGKGVQSASVRINKSGNWHLGVQNGNSYSYAAQFEAVGVDESGGGHRDEHFGGLGVLGKFFS